MTVEHNAGPERFLKTLPEEIPQRAHSLRTRIGSGQVARSTQGHNQQHVLRTGAPPGFMSGAMHQGFELLPLPDIESADSLGSIEFVPRYAEHVRMQSSDLGGNFAVCLGSIRVKNDSSLARKTSDLGNQLQCAYLVVGVHHADQ